MRPVTDIYRFLDYRSWLRAEYEERKAQDERFSHRKFSSLCGYKSSGALALIMSGRRNLTRDAAERVSLAFDLDPGERAHLVRMLDYEDAEDFGARAAVLGRMKAARKFAEHWQGTIDAYAYYEDPLVPVVRELVSLDDFREDGDWMAARVHGGAAPSACTEALARLIELGHLDRDDEGRLRHAHRIVATPAEVRSDTLKAYQRNMMERASAALDSQERERRDMRVSTMAISEGQAARIKALMEQVHKEVMAIVEEDEPIEAVYQLNTQFFSLTDPTEENQ